MPESSHLQSVLESAERAAAGGDLPSAQGCLRVALRLQEAALGPHHPELANTLNNLAVVCERLSQIGEAEHCYRRALAVASAALAPDHPYVVTSRQNLEQFCVAQGLPLDLPAAEAAPKPAPQLAPEPEPESASQSALQSALTFTPDPAWGSVPEWARELAPSAETEHANISLKPVPPIAKPSVGAAFAAAVPVRPSADQTPRVLYTDDTQRHPAPSSRRIAIGAAIIGTLALVLVVMIRPWRSSAAESVGTSPARPTEAAAKNAPPPVSRNRAATKAASSAAASSTAITVVDARLCRDFSASSSGEWTCSPPGNPVTPGRLTFYTRIKSPVDTVVQHRWYLDGQLRQTGELRIAANLNAGYRTYSRHTIDDLATGTWRVALHAKDGRLLHEERFVVQ